MYKKVNVVMLPTNEKSKLVLSFKEKSFNQLTEPKLTLIEKANYQMSNIQSQHLYITSDDEIKEGDWIYENDLKTINQAGDNYIQNSNDKKIITTTNSSLLIPHEHKELPDWNLPQIPQQFIEHYVSKYNKGNVITDVLVEYEKCSICKDTKKHIVAMFGEVDCNYCEINEGYENLYINPKLKINPKDNTITIKKIKDSWSREEVINLIWEAVSDVGSGMAYCEDEVKKWIEQNL